MQTIKELFDQIDLVSRCLCKQSKSCLLINHNGLVELLLFDQFCIHAINWMCTCGGQVPGSWTMAAASEASPWTWIPLSGSVARFLGPPKIKICCPNPTQCKTQKWLWKPFVKWRRGWWSYKLGLSMLSEQQDHQWCNRGKTIRVSPNTEFCLRIWIPNNTVFVLSHFPETIHTYSCWKVRQVFCIVSDDWSHQKHIWPYLRKNKDFFFICKSKSETMYFLTNKRNIDTGIRLKIRTMWYNTNTCLISVALLRPPSSAWQFIYNYRG